MDWKFEISRHKLLHTRSIPGDPDGKESTINARTWVRSLGQEDPWRREWLSTQAFLPGEFHGQRSLVGYIAWGCKKSDITEQLTLSLSGKQQDPTV